MTLILITANKEYTVDETGEGLGIDATPRASSIFHLSPMSSQRRRPLTDSVAFKATQEGIRRPTLPGLTSVIPFRSISMAAVLSDFIGCASYGIQ